MAAFAARILEKEWMLSPVQKGFIGTSLYFGYTVGGAICGLICDYFGRKVTILWFTAWTFGIGIISALMPDFITFVICRATMAVGIGAFTGILTTYLAEFYPNHARGKIMTLHGAFFEVGEIYCCLVSYFLIP